MDLLLGTYNKDKNFLWKFYPDRLKNYKESLKANTFIEQIVFNPINFDSKSKYSFEKMLDKKSDKFKSIDITEEEFNNSTIENLKIELYPFIFTEERFSKIFDKENSKIKVTKNFKRISIYYCLSIKTNDNFIYNIYKV